MVDFLLQKEEQPEGERLLLELVRCMKHLLEQMMSTGAPHAHPTSHIAFKPGKLFCCYYTRNVAFPLVS